MIRVFDGLFFFSFSINNLQGFEARKHPLDVLVGMGEKIR